MPTPETKQGKDGLRYVRAKDLIYPAILSFFIIIVFVLFFIATGFISKNLGIAFTDDINTDSGSLNMANYTVVTKKLGINTEAKESTPPAQVSIDTSSLPEETTTTPILYRKNLTLYILNGTATSGLAGTLATSLESSGFAKAKTGNEKTLYATTTVAIKESKASFGPSILEAIRKTYPDVISSISPESALFDVIIIIGTK